MNTMDLVDKYIIARWCYGIGEDFIDDIEYRYIEDKLKEQGLASEYTSRSWSDDPCPLELLQKYDLMKYYRDISFLYQSESIRSVNSMLDLQNEFSRCFRNARLSYKLDGWNLQVNYYNGRFISANTRGRSGNHLKVEGIQQILPKEIPIKGKVKITGELTIPNKKWLLMKLEMDCNVQRSSVRTALANDMYEYLAFTAFKIKAEDGSITGDSYEILKELGFSVPTYVNVTNYNTLLKGIEIMGRRNKSYAYPTDGLVYEDGEKQVALRVGEWQEDILQSYITGYAENRGVYGDALVAKIRPIKVGGTKRSEVSVTNMKYIINNDLRVGYPIAFDIRSAVGAVLNETFTAELHHKWKGDFESYRQMIEDTYEKVE